MALPASYEYVLTSSCGLRSLLGDYRVVVVDDEECYAVSGLQVIGP